MNDSTNKQLSVWLYTGACCIFLQILLGGITRLTGSGLSITEWQPLLGFLPPASTAAWQRSFHQYQQIAQFKLVNSHFSLADYQSIFFWEWLHRNWARMTGLIFIVPFIVFVVKKKISSKMFMQLIFLFILGLLQALIGWIMVKSGLNDTAIAVNDVRLAIHFMTALLLLCYILRMAFRLSIPPLPATETSGAGTIAGMTLAVVVLQMFFGALMAGSKAALSAPTWPDMNGYLIPPELYTFHLKSGNTYLLAIQLIHRLTALLTIIMVLILYKRTAFLKTQRLMSGIRIIPLTLICIQIILGAVTVLNCFNDSYLIYAMLHQCTGLLLLVSTFLVFYLSRTKTGTPNILIYLSGVIPLQKKQIPVKF